MQPELNSLMDFDASTRKPAVRLSCVSMYGWLFQDPLNANQGLLDPGNLDCREKTAYLSSTFCFSDVENGGPKVSHPRSRSEDKGPGCHWHPEHFLLAPNKGLCVPSQDESCRPLLG